MDLLNTLGKKETSAEGAAKAAPQSTKTEDTSSSKDLSRGTDLLKTVGSNKSESAATVQNESAGVKNSNPDNSSQVEPAGSQDAWTTDSALKEIKKLREENKAVRVKYQESVEKLKTEMDERISVREKQLEESVSAKKELEELKEKEADKKRDMAERLANRESIIAEMKARNEATEKLYQDRLKNLELKLSDFDAQVQAQRAVSQKRLEEELSVIPEKYKEVASLIVKGAGEPTDALVALHEAKIKGLFEDKTVVVNHSVPGAHDGARATKERLEAADKEAKSKMTPQQKIGTALKEMRSGTANTAFRTKNNF